MTTDRDSESTESPTDTESATESATESGTESDTAANISGGKKGFTTPLEAIAFFMGVPVIISVFAVIASIFRRAMYGKGKQPKQNGRRR